MPGIQCLQRLSLGGGANKKPAAATPLFGLARAELSSH